MLVQLLFSPLVTAAIFTTEVFPHGYPDCPCIDPYPVLGPGTNDTSCSGVSRASATGGAGTCYPREYGAKGCRRYDGASSDECQGRNPPGWCQDQWCFVSPWDCLKPKQPSIFFGDNSVGNEMLVAEAAARNCTGAECNKLHYSYATCGNIDHFTLYFGLKEKMDSFAARGTLRVTIPGDDPPYALTVGANTTDFVPGTSRRDGSIPRFILGESGVLNEFGFAWKETPISAASRAFSPDSSYTACAHDVAINNTDICVGPFWTFEYRQRLADFTFSFEQQVIKVVAFQATGATGFDPYELLYRPFKPFTMAMWLNMLVALLYAGYVMYVLDASGTEKPRASRLERGKTPAYFPRASSDAKDCLVSLANSLQGFLGGGDFRHHPRGLLSWMVFIGFSFLVLVMVSNYTAQITAMSVLRASSGTITSLDEGISRGYKFCGWASAQQSIEAAFPLIRGFYVPLEDGSASYKLMDNGECDAALVTEDSWAIATGGSLSLPEDDARYANHANGAARYHCDTKIVLPEIVVAFDIAVPVRRDLQRPLSWAMTIGKDMGKWRQEKELARQMFIQTSACDAVAADTQSLSLTFETGAGIVFISVVLSSLALVLNAFKLMCCKSQPTAAAAEAQATHSQHSLEEDMRWNEAAAAHVREREVSRTAQNVSYESELSRGTLPARTATLSRSAPRDEDPQTANTKWVL